MATIGDKNKFAVDYELAQDYCGAWLIGQFCYWVEGKMVGDYHFHTYLCDLIGALVWIVHDNGKREHERLFNLETKELLKLLDDTLPENLGDESEYYKIAVDECWARFSIRPEIDIFYDWDVYLIDSPSFSRMIYANFTEDKLKGEAKPLDVSNLDIVEVNFEPGTFDRVIKEFQATLINLWEIEVAKKSFKKTK